METTKTNIGTASAVVLAIAALVMNVGLIGQDNVYACVDLQTAMQCDKLSAVNDNGIQTRCYYTDELEATRYKNCKSGWLPYTPTVDKPTLSDINMTDKKEVFLVCEKTSELINECQIIDSEEIVFRLGITND